MNQISEQDWSFERIRGCCLARAARLESANPPEALVAALCEALGSASVPETMRLAVDSKKNKFEELRSIIQFRVVPELYDWFFNARTGYRAQFWIDPETGMHFNEALIGAAVGVLRDKLPDNLRVRRIEVQDNPRSEWDAGATNISRDRFLASLVPAASKIWIGERLYDAAGGPVELIGEETLRAADESEAKLSVPRWAAAGKREGLYAPHPAADCSWLDLKGGFLSADGTPQQLKPQEKRARDIHETGWT